jgi:hypothetical protein
MIHPAPVGRGASDVALVDAKNRDDDPALEAEHARRVWRDEAKARWCQVLDGQVSTEAALDRRRAD